MQRENRKRKQDEVIRPITSLPPLRTLNGFGTTVYGDTVYFVCLWIPVCPWCRFLCVPTEDGYEFFGELELRKWQKIWKWTVAIIFSTVFICLIIIIVVFGFIL